MVLRLRQRRRHPRWLRAPRAAAQRAARLVLGLPGRRGPAARGRARSRRAPARRRVARGARRGSVGRAVCETPNDHWSVNLEAFGVALDDPAEAYRGERGDRIAARARPRVGGRRRRLPVPGHDPLRAGRARSMARCSSATSASRSTGGASATTRGACATGGRSRGAGPRAGWATAPRFHAATTLLEGVDWHPGFVVAPGTTEAATIDGFTVATETGDERLPGRGAHAPARPRPHRRPARPRAGAARGDRRAGQPLPPLALPLRRRRRPRAATAGPSGTSSERRRFRRGGRRGDADSTRGWFRRGCRGSPASPPRWPG